MSGKFHINPETGKAGTCTASVKPCKYGADTPHFKSPEDAQMNYELKMADQVFSTHTKSVSGPEFDISAELASSELESHQASVAEIYTISERFASDAESGSNLDGADAATLREASRRIDEIVATTNFTDVFASRRSLDRFESLQEEFNRQANETKDEAKSTALFRASESLADVLIKHEY